MLQTLWRVPKPEKLDMGANHLSCCSTLLHLGHQPEKRRLMSWSITKEKRKEKRVFEFPFFRLVIPRRKNVLFWKVYAWSLEKMQS